MARSFELTGKYLSQQTFGVGRKVAEVNWAMLGENQDFIFEIHPEVSFWALAGRPMQFRKTWTEGFDERRALLEEALAMPLWSREEARLLAGPAQPDDVLDADVAAWTARRQADGIAERFPLDPPIDARGLRMEIVY
jgi:predicted RNase H-like nuclease